MENVEVQSGKLSQEAALAAVLFVGVDVSADCC